MNKRDLLLNMLDPNTTPASIPAAFFIHFDPAYHLGQAAVDKHLEYFNYTGMDFVKIQLELPFPVQPQIQKPEDWKTKLPFFTIDHYEPMLKVVEGLVKAAKKDALILLTLYSPFMECNNMVGQETVARHIEQDPEAFKIGIDRMTESIMQFVRACIRLGLDGFYTSTQGGEKARLSDPALFDTCNAFSTSCMSVTIGCHTATLRALPNGPDRLSVQVWTWQMGRKWLPGRLQNFLTGHSWVDWSAKVSSAPGLRHRSGRLYSLRSKTLQIVLFSAQIVLFFQKHHGTTCVLPFRQLMNTGGNFWRE